MSNADATLPQGCEEQGEAKNADPPTLWHPAAVVGLATRTIGGGLASSEIVRPAFHRLTPSNQEAPTKKPAPTNSDYTTPTTITTVLL